MSYVITKMSFTTYFRYAWVGLHKYKIFAKSNALKQRRLLPKVILPISLGFSIFTWLGVDKKASLEDDLILSIKHSVLFINKKEYDKAEQLLHVALRQAQQINHQLGITYIYDVMANLALEREQLDKSKKLFVTVAQRLMADGVQEDDLKIIHISLKLARISHLNKEYETAQLGYDWSIKKLNDAIKENPTEDNIKLLAMAEDWYGRLFLDCNQNEHGLNFLISAMKRMEETNVEKEHIVVQLNDIGTVCEKLNKLDDSINYFQEAITKGKSLTDMEHLEAIYVNMGKVCIRKNLLAEARKNCGYGLRLALTNKNKEVRKQAEQCMNEINSLK